MTEQPNILLIMTDQQKATASHLYGNTFCETPSMQRLAEKGVLYENAITPHPLCQPARCALWTGQFPHQNGCRDNQTPMLPDATHAFKIWNDLGYHCGLIGKNHCFEHPDDLALFDTWNEISHVGIPENAHHAGAEWFRPIENINEAHQLHKTMTPQNPRFAYATSDSPFEDHSTGLVAGQTTRFLEAHQDEPFALWVSFPDPHEPWVCPKQYADMFPQEKIDLPPWRDNEFDETSPNRNRILNQMLSLKNESDEDIYGVLACYYGMVRFMDDGLGQILDTLDKLDLTRKTIIVFCSDHGDLMGEHGMQCKGGVFYDALVHVPLIVSYPEYLPTDVRDDSMVNLIDIVPTLFTLQGIEIPSEMEGKPLPNVTDTLARDVAFSEYGKGGKPFTWDDLQAMPEPHGRKTLIQSLQWREAEGRRKMVRTREWKYIHDPMGDKDELYDLVTDPWELTNVIGTPSNKPIIDELRLQLMDWSISTED
jgi:arylsulfatase